MSVPDGPRAPARDPELPKFVEDYLLACRAEAKSPNTIRWYEQKLRTLFEYLRSQRLPLNPADLTPATVRVSITHFQTTGISEFTTRGYVQVLKGLFTWLENEGYIDRNPIRRVKLPKTPRYVVRPLDEDEVRRLLAAPNPRRRAGSRDLAILLLLVHNERLHHGHSPSVSSTIEHPAFRLPGVTKISMMTQDIT